MRQYVFTAMANIDKVNPADAGVLFRLKNTKAQKDKVTEQLIKTELRVQGLEEDIEIKDETVG